MSHNLARKRGAQPAKTEAQEEATAERARGRAPVLWAVHDKLPRLSWAHAALLVTMLGLLVAAGTWFAMIDRETLKPSQAFPRWLKTVSYYSNLPIKLGALHLFLYGSELWNDPQSARRHIGQRLTTLWMQFFEHHRWGQHFHMQLETALQVVDIFHREKTGLAPRNPSPVRAGLAAVVLLMATTHAITSCCYHTLEEQLVGAALALLKLLAFDYFSPLQHLNGAVGASFTDYRALPVGAALLVGTVLVGRSVFVGSPDSLALLHHPTTLATLFFAATSGARRLIWPLQGAARATASI